jgi:cobalt-zinc-cadmium efflux system membrane fusion protein
MMRRIRVVQGLAAALLAGTVACRQTSVQPTSQAEKQQPVAVQPPPALPETVYLSSAAIAEAGITTWTVQPVDLEHLLVLNGSVEYDENRVLQLAANVKGRVAAILVDLGARVRQGDPLLRIESLELGRAREEFVRARADLRVASRAYERAKSLVQEKAISTGDFQAREGNYLSKKAAAEAAERALHLYGDDQDAVDRLAEGLDNHDPYPSAADAASLILRAPFAGRIVERKVTPGALFEALQPLLTLADLSSVWVFLKAYEKDLALLEERLPVTLFAEAYPEEVFHGRVDFLGSLVDEATRTIQVRASVPNLEGKLRPGMFVRAQIQVPKPEREAHKILAVPQSALQTLEGKTTVFVRTHPGSYVRHWVETGHTFEGFTEILSGVRPGDRIVTEGSFVLKSEFARASLQEGE